MVWPKYPGHSEILPRLYLGTLRLATNKNELYDLGITDLLTIETSPLHVNELAQTVKQYLFISALDHPNQDIMSDFDRSYNFIHDALSDPDRKVLVHCMAGVSRSASLVIAYVMKSKSISYQAAYDFVLNAREVIKPNEGFIEQLKLYQKMKCNIDLSYREYRYICLVSLLFEHRLPPLSKTMVATFTNSVDPSVSRNPSRKYNLPSITHLSRNMRKTVKYIINVYFAKLEPSSRVHLYQPEKSYRCAKCRTILFYDINVLCCVSEIVEDCGNIYIEPQLWMTGLEEYISGIVKCPKCEYKLGDYNWKCEDSCVTTSRACPAHTALRNVLMVKISKKKVDGPSTL